jgi:hypothetical protein
MNTIRCIETRAARAARRQIVAVAADGRRQIIAGLPMSLIEEHFT